jgi:hypothetical protein
MDIQMRNQNVTGYAMGIIRARGRVEAGRNVTNPGSVEY